MASSARLDELRKKFDENPRRYFAPLANEYRKSGDTDQAIAICREYLPQQPGHMSGHIVFGQALYEARQFEEAKTVFETALSLDPENLIALRHLGDIALILGETDAARGWYRRVLDADPRNEEIQAQLASLDSAASSAPTPAVAPAQPAADIAPAAPREVTPGSAPTVVVSAMKAPATTQPTSVSATSPTAEVRLEDVVPPDTPAATRTECPPETLSSAETMEVVRSAVVPERKAGETNEPVEGLESHAAGAEAPPLDSFTLDGLETTSMSHGAPAAQPAMTGSETERAAPEPTLTAEAQADEPPPLDLDLSGVASEAPASAAPMPAAGEAGPDLVFISPDEPMPAADDSSAMPTSDQRSDDSATAGGASLELITPDAEAPATGPVAELAPEGTEAAAVPQPAASGPFVTETMAELYLRQGHREEALRVYKALLDQRPDDASLADKVRRLQAESIPVAATPSGPRFGDILRMVAERRPGFRPEHVHTNGAAPASEVADLVSAPIATEPPTAQAAETSAPFGALHARADALASALGFSVAGAADEEAANVLVAAFASGGNGTALQGAPARAAANELSLDAVFGAEAQAPAPAPSSFSFDQFFASKQEAGGGGRESPEEAARFTQWLEGLKRR